MLITRVKTGTRQPSFCQPAKSRDCFNLHLVYGVPPTKDERKKDPALARKWTAIEKADANKGRTSPTFENAKKKAKQ
eukprot:COSAG02_NODE_3122_length_7324_cov_548.027958_4_plen_77_part_00